MSNGPHVIDRIIRETYSNPVLRDCPYYNKEDVLPTWDVLLNYARTHGIDVRTSQHLPESLLGVAVKRYPENQEDPTRVDPARHGRHRYHIVLNAGLGCGFAKLYIAAHELGHILLHAKILAAPAQLAFATHAGKTNLLSHYAEIEASAFALLVLIPDRTLQNLEDLQSLSARTLVQHYRERTDMILPEEFACDRIIAFQMCSNRARSRRPSGTWCFIGDVPIGV